MINSMTGFGRGEAEYEAGKYTVEIKSVNHRYLDLSIKLPKKLISFESEIRAYLKDRIGRGKVDVYVTYEAATGEKADIVYHPEVASAYLTYLKQMSNELDIENDIRVSALSRFPEVFTIEDDELNEEDILNTLKEALEKALVSFTEARSKEGANLKADLLDKLNELKGHVDFIEKRSPEIIAEYREKINSRVLEILGDTKVDESRLLTEVTVFADKSCVDEEIVRLKSHSDMLINTLNTEGANGRKLDFIVQELNREANTILSKSTDLEISNRGIELKTLIEKIREQVQNIE
ncbi:MAG TPA: YicC family protein [Lachnospiraceae bacterium]|nr:YicC family protein [Lachnospiraceae bacterium]